jgi:hypothetical protein
MASAAMEHVWKALRNKQWDLAEASLAHFLIGFWICFVWEMKTLVTAAGMAVCIISCLDSAGALWYQLLAISHRICRLCETARWSLHE